MDLGQLEVYEQPPKVAEYLALRSQAGMNPRSEAGAEIALRNSYYAVTVYLQGELIGMGRVIGDGGCHMQVVDMAVRPDLQRQGIGKMIFGRIVDYLKREAPDKTFVSLIADGPADKLYRKFGFDYTQPEGQGMYMRIQSDRLVP
ncbi:GNAT family N-acetyltransferase [Paenibacillus sp. SN-8-1]|uniref:GNAT family N-acetyltransferase n=1 Tax=Paenibacillus sp. SN-8-1 TaxID=3435409 RepID=UPI003D9A35BB